MHDDTITLFPEPVRLGANMTRFRLSAIERYERACAGEPEPEPRASVDERWLRVTDVAKRLHCSTPTVWRRVVEAREARAGHGTRPAGHADQREPAAA